MDNAKVFGLGNWMVVSFTEVENTCNDQNGGKRPAWNSS